VGRHGGWPATRAHISLFFAAAEACRQANMQAWLTHGEPCHSLTVSRTNFSTPDRPRNTVGSRGLQGRAGAAGRGLRSGSSDLGSSRGSGSASRKAWQGACQAPLQSSDGFLARQLAAHCCPLAYNSPAANLQPIPSHPSHSHPIPTIHSAGVCSHTQAQLRSQAGVPGAQAGQPGHALQADRWHRRPAAMYGDQGREVEGEQCGGWWLAGKRAGVGHMVWEPPAKLEQVQCSSPASTLLPLPLYRTQHNTSPPGLTF